MKKFKTIALMMGIALTGLGGLTACSSENNVENNPNVVVDENGMANVRPEFVISIPRSVVGTRMANGITQADGSVASFRGLDNISLIPFVGVPADASTKAGDIIRLSNIPKSGGLSSTPSINYKVWADQLVPVGTTNFLFYAKAIDRSAESAITTMSDKFTYGYLTAYGLSNSTFTAPSGITFALEPINTSSERQAGNAVGQNIVELLNSLANTTVSGATVPHDSWNSTTEATLANLYQNFIKISVSSSNSLAIILSRLYFSLGHIQSTSEARKLADALKKKIEDACDGALISGTPAPLLSDYAGYPGNIGLPDGAARVKWNANGDGSNSFTDITADYGNGNTIDITKYVYPAALWYYVNTPLKAADTKKSSEYATAGNWDGVISSVYNGDANVVGEGTQSVALVNPVQYGVGRLETTIKMGEGTFYDSHGDVIVTGDYQLTGILLGGQNSAGFDFTTKGTENLTIYDRNMAGEITAKINSVTATANQTLALETRKDQKVYMALELVNGGEDFQGADGIIPAGGTFYLTAELDPLAATTSGYKAGECDKIIIQDHVTKVVVTIKNGSADGTGGGLGNATNGIPDLSSPGIEVGTSVNLEWKQGLTLQPSI